MSPGCSYQIGYGAMVPRWGEARNLLEPAVISASHIAFGSIPKEPVFTFLGEIAGVAATKALDAGIDVQDAPIAL